MGNKIIQAIGEKEFGQKPLNISRKTIGICNEVYEINYASASYILRMNHQKHLIYGTHKHLPLFKQLEIKTPQILAEDYSQNEFPVSYQILNKIEGKDIGLVMDELNQSELKEIAIEISSILDKFQSLPMAGTVGEFTWEADKPGYLLKTIHQQREDVIRRNSTSNVIGNEVMEIYTSLIKEYTGYFSALEPKVYYDDICYKNVMVHNGKFTGLVDLDFLLKGDYLEAIGRMRSCWFGQSNGEFYIEEIIRLQKLNDFQRKIVNLYAILNLVLWTSEAGRKFNGNTSGEINWENVERNKRKVIGLYNSMK